MRLVGSEPSGIESMVDGHEEDHDGDVDIVVVDVDPTAGEEDDVPELFQREVVTGQEDHTSGILCWAVGNC